MSNNRVSSAETKSETPTTPEKKTQVPQGLDEELAQHDASKKQKKEEKKKEGDEMEGLDSEEPTGTIKLVSKDKKEFVLEKKHSLISTLVKTTLEQDTTATEVPLPGVGSETLTRIVEYMNHHKGTEPPIIPKPLRSKDMKVVCSDPWDAKFIDEIADIRQDLYDLILAANYMDVKSLLHLGCAKVASLIKGQPLEKIKEILTQKKDEKEDKGQSDTKSK